jgi:hypothetical protein
MQTLLLGPISARYRVLGARWQLLKAAFCEPVTRISLKRYLAS